MTIKKIKRSRILTNGIAFLTAGFLFMLCDVPCIRLLGGIGIFIGSLSLIIYNSEKYKYFKLLHIALSQKGYNVSFKKQRLICLLLCMFLFFCNSFSWGFMAYINLIPQWVVNVVGGLYILFLLPLALSPDDIEKQLANESVEKLIDLMKNPQYKANKF